MGFWKRKITNQHIGWHASSWTILNAKINASISSQNSGSLLKCLCTQFQQCRLFNYFVTVDLVTSPKITALLHHSVYITVHGKVIKMEHLIKSQLRAQAVRLTENYSYSVIAKKLGHSKAWVDKWAKRWKTNAAECLQSQSRWRLTNKTALNLNAQRIRPIRKNKYQMDHSLQKLEKMEGKTTFWKSGDDTAILV